MRYRRLYQGGGCYFFTVVTAGRRPPLGNHETVRLLRQVFATVRARYPFTIDAAVILPNHLHCVWTLPTGDADFSTRWRLIKTCFSKRHATENACWQPRFWEHAIRGEQDFANHLDYVHFNPVKHGLGDTPIDWPFTSLHQYIARGDYPPDWGLVAPSIPSDAGHE